MDILYSQEHSGLNHLPWTYKLMAAVIRRAIVDWVLYKDHENIKMRRMGKEAEKWLFEDSTSWGLSEFSTTCNVLGLDIHVIRERVEKLTEDEVRRLRGMEFGDEC